MIMARRKIDFQKALMKTGGAFAGGVASGFVVREIGDRIFPNKPSNAAFVPLALGAVLSVQKNELLASAGLGMVGAMSNVVAENLNLGITGVSRLNAGRTYTPLSEGEQAKIREMQMRRKQSASVNGAQGGARGNLDFQAYQKAVATN